MQAQIANLQQASNALVDLARSIQATLDQEREAVLEEARAEAERVREEARAEIELVRERMVAETRRECESMLRDAERQHAQLTREIRAMSEVHAVQDSVVKLDVGGHVFSTSVHTLRSVPHSMLDAMMSGRFEMKETEEGCLFIDRDGSLFGHVLGWLRDRVVDVEGLDATTLRRLKREFSFFGLETGRVEERRWAYVVGGLRAGRRLADVERYDDVEDACFPGPRMQHLRSDFGIAVVGGVLYVTGGWNGAERMNSGPLPLPIGRAPRPTAALALL